MPRERCTRVLDQLHSLDIEALPAATCQEARGLLERKSRVELVISDLSLADGNWCDVFKHLVDKEIHAAMVVVARQADERLWSEVLWRGAYDLLVEPLDKTHVQRVVEGAVRTVQAAGAGLGASAELAAETALAATP
jgi:DNA-binding NtrC family response regulator